MQPYIISELTNVQSSQGSLNGPLILTRNPLLPLEIATKQYVDGLVTNLNADNFTTGIIPSSILIEFTGDISNTVGSNVFTLPNIIASGVYTKLSVNNKGLVTTGGPLSEPDIPNLDWSILTQGTPTTAAGYGINNAIHLSGDTITGPLMLHADPLSDYQLVTKQLADTTINNNNVITPGAIIRKAIDITPAGFLKCNGSEVSKTTYSNLYISTGDKYDINYIVGNGKPWSQQYGINKTQTGNITWTTSGTGLFAASYVAQLVVTKNRVYSLGGSLTAGYHNNTYTAQINADGTLATWYNSSPLPGVLSHSCSVVTKNRVYLLGGFNGTSYVSVIYTTQINADGTLGTWVNDTNTLPIIGGLFKAVLTSNKIYLLGATNGNIYFANLNTDGTIGSWSLYGALPAIVLNPNVVVTKNKVFLLGGATISNTVLSTVYSTVINPDGTLGLTWTTENNLPEPIYAAQTYVTNNTVYLIGGANTVYYQSTISRVYRANINSDGTMGDWLSCTPMPVGISGGELIAVNGKLYIIGGFSSTAMSSTIYIGTISEGLNDYSPYYTADTTNYGTPGMGKPWNQQYQINTLQSNILPAFTTNVGTLPIALGSSQVMVTKNRAYILGGFNGTSDVDSIYTAPINTDGTLGTWVATSTLPVKLYSSQLIVTKNRAYLLGGISVTTVVNTIYTAPINIDGTLGSWVSSGTLPVQLHGSSAVVTNNRVYLLGGSVGIIPNTPSSTVYTAPINIDGTLGTWVPGTNLPIPLMLSTAVVTNNRVYLITGESSGSIVNNIYNATINSDGIIGSWVFSGTFPVSLRNWQAFSTNNTLYLFGGSNLGAGTNSLYTATIAPNGTLSSWIQTTAILPVPLTNTQFIVTLNHIHILGGYNGTTYTNDSYTTTISGGLNDYSPYYDGTIVPNVPVNKSSVFKLPDFSTLDDLTKVYHYIKY